MRRSVKASAGLNVLVLVLRAVIQGVKPRSAKASAGLNVLILVLRAVSQGVKPRSAQASLLALINSFSVAGGLSRGQAAVCQGLCWP